MVPCNMPNRYADLSDHIRKRHPDESYSNLQLQPASLVACAICGTSCNDAHGIKTHAAKIRRVSGKSNRLNSLRNRSAYPLSASPALSSLPNSRKRQASSSPPGQDVIGTIAVPPDLCQGSATDATAICDVDDMPASRIRDFIQYRTKELIQSRTKELIQSKIKEVVKSRLDEIVRMRINGMLQSSMEDIVQSRMDEIRQSGANEMAKSKITEMTHSITSHQWKERGIFFLEFTEYRAEEVDKMHQPTGTKQ